MPAVTDREAAQPVVKLRHSGTWVATAVVLLIIALAAYSAATNPAFEWPVVAQYMFDAEILTGLQRTLQRVQHCPRAVQGGPPVTLSAGQPQQCCPAWQFPES